MLLTIIAFLVQVTSDIKGPAVDEILKKAAPAVARHERAIWQARALAAEAEVAKIRAQIAYSAQLDELEQELRKAGHMKPGCKVEARQDASLALVCPPVAAGTK